MTVNRRRAPIGVLAVLMASGVIAALGAYFGVTLIRHNAKQPMHLDALSIYNIAPEAGQPEGSHAIVLGVTHAGPERAPSGGGATTNAAQATIDAAREAIAAAATGAPAAETRTTGATGSAAAATGTASTAGASGGTPSENTSSGATGTGSVIPTPSNEGAIAGETPARTPFETSTPGPASSAAGTTGSSSASASPESTGAAARVELPPGVAASLRAVVPIDICAVDAPPAGCPDGVLGTIVGGREPTAPVGPSGGLFPHEAPSDIDLSNLSASFSSRLAAGLGSLLGATMDADEIGRAGGALDVSLFVRYLALVTSEDVASAADVAGCAAPSSDSVSFLVGTRFPSHLAVAFWPTNLMTGAPLMADTRDAVGHAELMIDRPVGGARFEGCVRLTGLHPGIYYQARATAVVESGDHTGDSGLTPTVEFCVGSCLSATEPVSSILTTSAFHIWPHAWGAEVTLDAVPVEPPSSSPGIESLTFFYRQPGEAYWGSTSLTSPHAPTTLASSPNLLPDTVYEGKVVYQSASGQHYESLPFSFRTLRRTLILTADLLGVIWDGDDLYTGDPGELLWFGLSFNPLTETGGVVPCRYDPSDPTLLGSTCSSTRRYRQFGAPIDGLSGDSPWNDSDQTVEIQSGTSIPVAPPFRLALLHQTARLFHLGGVAAESDAGFAGVGDSTAVGSWDVFFQLPAYMGAPSLGGSDAELETSCAQPGASLPLSSMDFYYRHDAGHPGQPDLYPQNAMICVIEE